MIKKMFRVYILVMIGGLAVAAGYAKQKADAPPVPPAGMVLIPAGEFQMGSNDPEAYNNQQPVHTVYVDAFYMDKYEVTNAQYKEFILANPEWGKDRINSVFHNEDYGNYLK